MWVVLQRMKRGSLAGKVGIVVLLALTVFVSAVRPIAQPTGRLFPRFGLIRMSLLSESPDTDSTPLPSPALVDAHMIEPPLIIALLLLVLKARPAAFRPVPFRRLKLPARSADRSPTSH